MSLWYRYHEEATRRCRLEVTRLAEADMDESDKCTLMQVNAQLAARAVAREMDIGPEERFCVVVTTNGHGAHDVVTTVDPMVARMMKETP